MKKLFALLLALMMVLALAGCQKTEPAPEPTVDPEPVDENPVLTYAEYAALPTDGTASVVIEGYVQGAQSYWDGATLYLQDKDGAYFVYGGKISEEDYAKLVDSTDYSSGWKGLANGTKVHVEGTKTEWSGEVEIADAVVTLVEGADAWKADAEDVTALLGTDGLADKMNRFVKLTDLVVEPSTDAEGNEVAFLYNWDGSGEEGTDSDLYFNASSNGNTYSFVVEYYLCREGSDVYEAVRNLNVGDTIDLEGFLYWYEGPQLHTTSVTVK